MDDFERGALHAISLIVRLHDETVIAVDVLKEMGLSGVDVSELDEFDKEPLRKMLKLEKHRGFKLKGLRNKQGPRK